MKQWNKINWPAMNRRSRKIGVDLQQRRPERSDFKEKGTTAPSTQTDRTNVLALMVWSDDGGLAA